jgi:hypothetical protein
MRHALASPFENAFAVFVAAARVATSQRKFERARFAVGFIDDQRRTLRPGEQLPRGYRRERHIAVEWLFDEPERLEEARERRIGDEIFPVLAERRNGLPVLIAIEGEGESPASASKDFSDAPQARVVAIEIAGELDFQIRDPLLPHARFQRLRQAVVELLVHGNFGIIEWIEKANGMPDDEAFGWSLGKPLRSGAAREFG